MVGTIKYKHENGFTGVLYGESSLAIYDKNNKKVMHTGFRNINTKEELIELLDKYPDFYNKLKEFAADTGADDDVSV